MATTLTRRDLLGAAAGLAALPLLSGCESADGDGQDGKGQPVELPTYTWQGDPGPDGMFAHGVASGDPLTDRVILWTRVTLPDAIAAAGEVNLFYEVARDVGFTDRVAAGEARATAARDWTCKVDAEGLQAGTSYYYRFWFQGRSSPVGRTRTLPAGAVDRLRLAFCSCSNFSSGYFTGYRKIAERADLDAVLHLGDYIYEYPGNPKNERFAGPEHICMTVEDYRTRYAAHRGDVDLQEAHRQHPFICVWDDHESANNAWSGGAPAHDEAKAGPWAERRGAAWQAWSEWIPARVGDEGKIWRGFEFGDLCSLWMLDTRLWGRTKQTTPSKKAELKDPARTFLGPDQEAWLHEGLQTSKAKWQVLGQQVMIAPLLVGELTLNSDQWDGYQATRDRLYARVRELGLDGFVVLTGDIHTSWANDLVEDSRDEAKYDKATGAGSLGAEFVVPGITSGVPATFGDPSISDLAREYNPHIRWNELQHRGYGVLDLSPGAAQCDWWLLKDIAKPGQPEFLAGSWRMQHGTPGLTKADSPAPDRTTAPALAP